MRRPLRIVISALLIFATGSLATAQVTEDEILKGIAQARQSGAQLSDEEVERIVQNFREEQTRFAQMQEELQWQDQLRILALLCHISWERMESRFQIPNRSSLNQL